MKLKIYSNEDKEEKIMSNEKGKVMKAMEKAGKPVRPGDVAKMTALESKDVSKVIKSLRNEGKVFSPKRCYYAVKTDKE